MQTDGGHDIPSTHLFYALCAKSTNIFHVCAIPVTYRKTASNHGCPSRTCLIGSLISVAWKGLNSKVLIAMPFVGFIKKQAKGTYLIILVLC
jgi:hypothetical protein